MIEQLVNKLGIGAENATSREYLASILQTDDRKIRKIIQQAREMGVPIISTSQVKGYFLPSSEQELNRFKAEQFSRIEEIKKGIAGIGEWNYESASKRY